MFELFKPRLVICAGRLQRIGTSGDDIAEFQRLLNRRGCRYQVAVPVTGVYDEATRAAVRLYQRRALSIYAGDGFVGPQTARKLRITLRGED